MAKTATEWAHLSNLSKNGMPRMPIFFCLDTSGSMEKPIIKPQSTLARFFKGGFKGLSEVEPSESVTRIQQLIQGLVMLYNKLTSEAITCNSVEISIVTFDDEARCHLEISNISDVSTRQINRLTTHNLTFMGEGLNMALDIMEDCLRDYQEFGVDYYTPWLIIMSDGEPNGDNHELNRAIARINNMRERENLVATAIAIGASADTTVFSRFVPQGRIISIHETQMNQLFNDITQKTKCAAIFSPADINDEMEKQIKDNEIENFSEFTGYGFEVKQLQDTSRITDTQSTILLIGSNPYTHKIIRIDKEVTGIMNALNKAENRDDFFFQNVPQICAHDLLSYLRQMKPKILHFSVHGSDDGDLEFTSNENGGVTQISPDEMARIIKHLSNPPKIVILNACNSFKIANAIIDYVEAVVCMKERILDNSAIIFSKVFYGAIADGETIYNAVEQAKVSLSTSHLPGENYIHLITKQP